MQEGEEIDFFALEMIHMQVACERYGWTVEEYQNTDVSILEAMRAVERYRQKKESRDALPNT